MSKIGFTQKLYAVKRNIADIITLEIMCQLILLSVFYNPFTLLQTTNFRSEYAVNISYLCMAVQ